MSETIGNEEEITIEINEGEEGQESSQEVDVDGLSEEELSMAKDQGLLEVEDGEDKESSESTEEEVEGEKVEEEVNTDPDDFEEIEKVYEKDEKKFHEKFTPNQKALYFKQKAIKQKYQAAVKEKEEVSAKLVEALKGSQGQAKLDEIAGLLGKEDLTVEMIQAVINKDSAVQEEDTGPIKPEVVQQKVAIKAGFAEKIGNAKYENFKGISELAGEVIANDPTGVLQARLDNAFLDESVDEAMLVETVVMVAKQSSKYDEVSGSSTPEKKKEVGKVIKNLKKKTSSASIGSTGKRIISESDLTAEQAVNLSMDKWNALSQKTKDRILGKK